MFENICNIILYGFFIFFIIQLILIINKKQAKIDLEHCDYYYDLKEDRYFNLETYINEYTNEKSDN